MEKCPPYRVIFEARMHAWRLKITQPGLFDRTDPRLRKYDRLVLSLAEKHLKRIVEGHVAGQSWVPWDAPPQHATPLNLLRSNGLVKEARVSRSKRVHQATGKGLHAALTFIGISRENIARALHAIHAANIPEDIPSLSYRVRWMLSPGYPLTTEQAAKALNMDSFAFTQACNGRGARKDRLKIASLLNRDPNELWPDAGAKRIAIDQAVAAGKDPRLAAKMSWYTGENKALNPVFERLRRSLNMPDATTSQVCAALGFHPDESHVFSEACRCGTKNRRHRIAIALQLQELPTKIWPQNAGTLRGKRDDDAYQEQLKTKIKQTGDRYAKKTVFA